MQRKNFPVLHSRVSRLLYKETYINQKTIGIVHTILRKWADLLDKAKGEIIIYNKGPE